MARPRTDFSETRRERTAEYKEKDKLRSRARAQRIYIFRSLITAIAKNKPCADCGGQFPYECMDFDHVRGEKKFCIGDRTKQPGLSRKQLMDLLLEIQKCDVVCSNCHRIRTKARGNFFGHKK